MRKKWMFFLIPPAIVLFIAVFGEIVMHLWNWLVPSLIGWRPITFWQALGILVLCRILFGGLGSHGPNRSRRKLADRWEKLTPEEREKFRQNLRSTRCGNFGTPTSGTGEPA